MIATYILIVLVFITGLAFFKLTVKFQKNKFAYPFLGILTFVLGVVLYIVLYYFLAEFLQMNRYFHEFLSLSLGLLLSALLYFSLKRKWKRIN